MSSRILERKILESSVDLWEFIKEQGGLDLNYYDKGILLDIRTAFGISSSASIEKHLQNNDISIENFLHVFFSAIAPFSQMFNDLLELFDRQGINQTNNSMIIKFNFDSNDSFEFNIKQFKVWINKWEAISSKSKVLDINSTILHKLIGVFETFTNKYIPNSSGIDEGEYLPIYVNNWLEEYYLNWPNSKTLILPKTSNRKLNKLLSQVQLLISDVIKSLSSLGVNYQGLKSLIWEMREEDKSKQVPGYAWMEIDFFIGQFIKTYSRTIWWINKSSGNIKAEITNDLINTLQTYIKSISSKECENILDIEDIMEYLQLPIWERRYDFYAAWILTQIANSIDRDSLIFHHTQGKLEFSFSGSHLATAKNYTPELHVWTELRSNIVNPIGKGRKRGIQPDYSILVPPLSDVVNSTILVVECKQYRKFSKKNFKNALIDYATGRPNAEVILVNYGPINEEMLNEIDEKIRPRTHIIGEMKPGNIESITKFKELVQSTTELYKNYEVHTKNIKKLKLEKESKIKIILTWEEKPRDLDLHLLFIELDNICYKINYSNKGKLGIKPFIELENDVTFGGGPEVITINKILEGTYLIAVKNYSNEVPMNVSNSKIRIEINGKVMRIECPGIGVGEWWIVAELNPYKNEYIIHNKIQSSLPKNY
jgi:hypothetical protein